MYKYAFLEVFSQPAGGGTGGGSGRSGTSGAGGIGGGGSGGGNVSTPPMNPQPQGGLTLQIGDGSGQCMKICIESMDTVNLGIDKVNLSTDIGASQAIEQISQAIGKVSEQRASLGAIQNHLQRTINNLENTAENLQAAESKIRDSDMVQEITEMTKIKIIKQAVQAMMSQANMNSQMILQLLQ